MIGHIGPHDFKSRDVIEIPVDHRCKIVEREAITELVYNQFDEPVFLVH